MAVSTQDRDLWLLLPPCLRCLVQKCVIDVVSGMHPGNGGYMCWVDITAGSGQTALEFQRGLLKVAGVQLGARYSTEDCICRRYVDIILSSAALDGHRRKRLE